MYGGDGMRESEKSLARARGSLPAWSGWKFAIRPLVMVAAIGVLVVPTAMGVIG